MYMYIFLHGDLEQTYSQKPEPLRRDVKVRCGAGLTRRILQRGLRGEGKK